MQHITTYRIGFVRAFLVLAGMATSMLGLGLLLLPGHLTNIFLNQPVPSSGLFFIRFAGTSLLGFSALNFYAARKNLKILNLATLVNITSLAPATLLSIWTYGLGYIDKYRWLIVLEHVFFLSGFLASWYILKSVAKSTQSVKLSS